MSDYRSKYTCPNCSIDGKKCKYEDPEVICPCGGGQSCTVDRRRSGDFVMADMMCHKIGVVLPCDCTGYPPDLMKQAMGDQKPDAVIIEGPKYPPKVEGIGCSGPCRYGVNCYRKNLEHLLEYYHPIGHLYTLESGTYTCPFDSDCRLKEDAEHNKYFSHSQSLEMCN